MFISPRSLIKSISITFVLLFAITHVFAQQTGYKVISWKKEANAVIFKTQNGVLKITPYLKNVVRVQFGTEEAIDAAKNYAVAIHPAGITFNVVDVGSDIVIKTTSYQLKISRASSHLSLLSQRGGVILRERPNVQRKTIKEDGAPALTSVFQLSDQEALYGLGQYRDGVLNLRGKERELVQVNTQVALPIVISTNGWGLFWDNPTRTIFKDSHEGMRFTSDYGDAISYYIFTGSSLDNIVDDYRNLTGKAPLLPRWAYGYHQSRNRYASQDELLKVAERMRQEHIPFSSIFIDYHYWGRYGTGSHHFDETAFPDIPLMMQRLHHDLHTKVIATVWPSFKPGSPNYSELAKHGYLLNGVEALDGIVYDPFNPKAAAMYWNQVAHQLIPTQIDGWFLDGPEPDNSASFLKANTYLGPAVNVRNLFPLFHSTNFYNGLNSLDSAKRYYLITRSAWASQQKNSTVVWSGDIGSSFDELKKQIVAGLNFTASGIPYWTTDVGGYSGGNPADPAYQEVFTRWWQYGVFCPIFRSHGRRYPGDTKGPNELWAFGANTQKICTVYDELRYRLLPYIYSLAAKVTFQNYTPMRLLAFDFPGDTSTHNIKDEFMYGPAFLVCPVTDAGAIKRKVYLPENTKWIDFWTGQMLKGGQMITADAPIDKIPLFIKSGSIIPMGPVMQYTDEQPAAPIELHIYPGADGQFEIYEDDGASNAYKRGEYATVALTWDDKAHTLLIGKRKGQFTGMMVSRKFKIVVVSPKTGTGMHTGEANFTTITYNGTPQLINVINK